MAWAELVTGVLVAASTLGGVALGASLQGRSSLTLVKRAERKETYANAIRSADDLFELVKTNLPHAMALAKGRTSATTAAPIGEALASQYVREFRIQRRMLRVLAPNAVADAYDELFRSLNSHWWVAGLPKPLELRTEREAVEELVDHWAPRMERFVTLMGNDLGPATRK